MAGRMTGKMRRILAALQGDEVEIPTYISVATQGLLS